jgi:DNA replication and repair protein RecF
MILSQITLRNFRKHINTNLNFSTGLNYIIGGNGQGKTSVLEAIYYLCTTKGFGSGDQGVLRFNENDFEITGSFRGTVEDKVKVFFSLDENKKYYILNGKNVNRVSDVIGKFPVVMLTPRDHDITQEGPAERRKFVDSVLSQASETYFRDLLEYNKTLRQRTAVLNKLKEFKRDDYIIELNAWSENLVKLGSTLIRKRIKFINFFLPYVLESYSKIMESKEIPAIKYSYLEGYEGEDIESRFEELIAERRSDEMRRGVNLVGPHRDEFIFELDGLNLKSFGSQGQHKTFQVVLRFAEFFYLKEASGKTPVFMLDDVFGELDMKRSEKISSYLREVGQAFITLTDFTNFAFIEKHESDFIIRLNEGSVVYA